MGPNRSELPSLTKGFDSSGPQGDLVALSCTESIEAVSLARTSIAAKSNPQYSLALLGRWRGRICTAVAHAARSLQVATQAIKAEHAAREPSCKYS